MAEISPAAEDPGNRAPPRTTPAPPEERTERPPEPTDDGAEVDVWWGSYSGWAMFPQFVAGGLAVVIVGVAVWYLSSEAHWADDVGRYVVYAFVAGIGAFQVGQWLYRVVFYNYRLTSRRLFCWQGPLHRHLTPIELKQVQRITVLRSALERKLGVGRIRVETPTQTVLLSGVRDPKRIAAWIERRAETAGAKTHGPPPVGLPG